MNIEIPKNLCLDLHTAKVGDIVVLTTGNGSRALRLVTHVTSTRISIQNGGGVGTKLTFVKATGQEHGATRFLAPLRLEAATPQRYEDVIKEDVKDRLVHAIHHFNEDNVTFAQVYDAALRLGVTDTAFAQPKPF